MTGGRGAWIINHMLTVGGGGYALTNDIEVTDDFMDSDPKLLFEYGGFELGLILASDKMMHFSVNSLIGTGRIGYRSGDRDESVNEKFFIVEPSANLILNMVKWFRIGLGASYRYVNGVEDFTIKDAELSGLAAVITFKFGSF